MKVLVTGGSGFMGRNFLLRAPHDWQILAVYRNDASFPAFVAASGKPGVTAAQCDLADHEAVRSLFSRHGEQWDGCAYFSAKVDIPWSVREPKHDLVANAEPLLNVLEAIRCDRFVYFSSGAVYDGIRGVVTASSPISPTLPYAISKLACEHYVSFYSKRRKSIGNYINVRFFGAYGPWEAHHKIYTRLVRAFVIEGKREYTIYGDGRNLIDAMYVDDAVDAVCRMLAGSVWNRTVNLAVGNPLTVEELVRNAGRFLGCGEIGIRKEGVAHENIEFQASLQEIRDDLGFEPAIGLSDGLLRLRDFLLTAGAGRPRLTA
jgi:UDP-glucose 4-epimerase